LYNSKKQLTHIGKFKNKTLALRVRIINGTPAKFIYKINKNRLGRKRFAFTPNVKTHQQLKFKNQGKNPNRRNTNSIYLFLRCEGVSTPLNKTFISKDIQDIK